MTLYILTFLTALLLSGVAEYFSIMGLIAIFAAAPIPVAVMGVSLGIAKLVAASWVYRNWSLAPTTIKYYFTIAVVILSLITSMGIFGYLSKAHMDQSLTTSDVQSKITLIDEKIKIEKDNIDVNRKAIKQMDESVDQVMGRTTDEKGADKAASLRKTQQKERNRLLAEIETYNKRVSALNEERAPIASEIRKVEAEVGPIKYIAALMYGDDPDTNLLERAVRWVIITIVLVFDPMAILLLIAANFTQRQLRGEVITAVETPESSVTNFFKQDFFVEEPSNEPTQPLPQAEEVKVEEKRKWSPELYARVKRILYPYSK